MLTGTCACGQVHYTCDVMPTNASTCHCTQCRKMSGHVWASAQVPGDTLHITGPVRWIALTAQARRGVCPNCGAFLFWQGVGESEISIALGSVDGPTGLRLQKQIFTANKGDYYDLSEDIPQRP